MTTKVQVQDLPERTKRFVKAYSKKRNAMVETSRSTVELHSNYWSEGSITYYKVLHADGQEEVLVGKHPFSPGGQESYQLADGDVVLSYGVYCGKPSTPMLYVKGDRP